MSRYERRTLLASEIKNLTKEEMWVYGTSGELIELKPTMSDVLHERKNTYYVLNSPMRKYMESDKRVRKHLAVPVYIGEGPSGEPIYKFKNVDDLYIVPITDNTISASGIAAMAAI